MKLLISVVNRDDTYQLTDALLREGLSATVISTTGGFLREGNATLLIGVADEKVPEALAIIGANCRTRTRHVSPWPPMVGEEEQYIPAPLEVQVGGAVVFIADVERFEKL